PLPPRASGPPAYEAVRRSHGLAVAVTDGEMRQALLDLGGREGIYCEPASAAAVAGARKLAATGALHGGRRVVCGLTSHRRKGGRAIGSWFEAPTRIAAATEAVRRAVAG